MQTDFVITVSQMLIIFVDESMLKLSSFDLRKIILVLTPTKPYFGFDLMLSTILGKIFGTK